jgi:hypothetical protein
LQQVQVHWASDKRLVLSSDVWHLRQVITPKKNANIFVDRCITENYTVLNMKRGLVTKSKAQPVAVWLPDSLKAQLDRAVQHTDTDRSKLIRAALREKLATLNLSTAA